MRADPEPGARRAGNQSISRASRLLRCFVDSPDGLTLTELARRTGLHPSTAHRMMTSLVDGGLISRGVGDRYRPGIAFLALGASIMQSSGLDAAQPFLETLTERTGETTSLAIKDVDCAVVLLETESSQPLIARQGAGSRLPLTDSAHGQVLLAFAGDPAAQIRSLPRPIVLRNEYADPDDLLAELTVVRQRGYSMIGDHEHATLAVPIPSVGADSVTRSVGVTAPSRRLTGPTIDRAVSAATEVAGLRRGIGWQTPPPRT